MKKNILIIVLLCITVIAVGAAIYFASRNKTPVPEGSQTEESGILEDDDSAEQIVSPAANVESNGEESDKTEESDTETYKRSAVVICSPNVEIDSATGEITIFYQNPFDSDSDVQISIEVQDYEIASSKLIKSGYQLTHMTVYDNVNIEKGVYNGKVLVSFFEKGNSTMDEINSEIPITVVVK